MKQGLKFRLNIQQFADEPSPDTPLVATTTPQVEIDYGKLDDIISKRASSAENGALKSFFQQQGLSETEVNEAINTFKASRQAKEDESKNKLTTLETEKQELINQLNDYKLKTKANTVASELGIDLTKLDYVMKLADTSKALDEKGEVNTDAIKDALTKVITDVPGFKVAEQQSGIKPIGAPNESGASDDYEKQLRKVMGLK